MPANRYTRPTVSAAARDASPADAAAADRAVGAAGACRRSDDRRPDRRRSARVWKAMEAKLVECPALSRLACPNSRRPTTSIRMPNCSASTIRPGRRSPPTDLGAKRGGGMVSFFWFRTTLTIPPRCRGFRHRRREDGADGECRRLCGGLGQRRDAARGRPAQPGGDPGLQHAQSPGAARHRRTRARSSRSRCSPSTARSRRRRRISCGSARRRSSSIADAGCSKSLRPPRETRLRRSAHPNLLRRDIRRAAVDPWLDGSHGRNASFWVVRSG